LVGFSVHQPIQTQPQNGDFQIWSFESRQM
jgi:hypothetical protein